MISFGRKRRRLLARHGNAAIESARTPMRPNGRLGALTMANQLTLLLLLLFSFSSGAQNSFLFFWLDASPAADGAATLIILAGKGRDATAPWRHGAALIRLGPVCSRFSHQPEAGTDTVKKKKNPADRSVKNAHRPSQWRRLVEIAFSFLFLQLRNL